MASAKVIFGGLALVGGLVAWLAGGTAKASPKKKGDDGGGGTPPPPKQKLNCSPSGPQDFILSRTMNPEEIAKTITGASPSAGNATDQELLSANAPASGPGWSYVYRIDVYDPASGNTKIIETTRKTFDHYEHPSAVAAPPNSNVTWEEVRIAAGTRVKLPLSWNKYLRWDGERYSSPGDGSTFPPCAP